MSWRDDFPSLERHTPERRQRQKKYIVLYSCCCCCCCCLHTVGGTIGAMICSSAGPRPVEPPDAPPRAHVGQGMYWGSLVIATALGTALILFISIQNASPYSSPMSDTLVITGLSLIIAGPVWLLAGAVVMALRVALLPAGELRTGYWRQLRRIVGGTLAGTIAGVAVMFVIGVLFSL